MYSTSHLSQTELLFHFKKNNLFSYYLMQGFINLIEQKNNDKEGKALLNYAAQHELEYLPKASFNLEFIDKLLIPINSLNMIHFIQVLAILQKDNKQEVFQALTFNALVYSAIHDYGYNTDANIYLNRLSFLLKIGMLSSISGINQLIIQTLLEQTKSHRKKVGQFTYQDLFSDYDEDDVMSVVTYFPAFEPCFRHYLTLGDPEQKLISIEKEIMIEIKEKQTLIKQQA